MRNKLAPSNAIRPSLGQFGVHCPDTAKGEQYAIMVVNGSDVPIYDIRVESQKADKSCDNPVLWLGALPPGEICYPRSPDVQVGLCH